MIKFKQGVEVEGITKECISAMSIASNVFEDKLGRNLVVTSCSDGTHREGSKHYEGNAFDVRTWVTDTSGEQMSDPNKRFLARVISGRLGDDYDVVVERTHIHVEYDPK